jgi:Tol biopolymer transport system component
MGQGGSIVGVRWAPDGSRIAYTADQNQDGSVELFTTRPDGSENVRVSRPPPPGGQVAQFAWSPDGSRIAYRAFEVEPTTSELFTVRPDGKITLPLPPHSTQPSVSTRISSRILAPTASYGMKQAPIPHISIQCATKMLSTWRIKR